jgi:hypothetical protein
LIQVRRKTKTLARPLLKKSPVVEQKLTKVLFSFFVLYFAWQILGEETTYLSSIFQIISFLVRSSNNLKKWLQQSDSSTATNMAKATVPDKAH